MAMIFGTAVSLLFAGVQKSRAGKIMTAIFYTLILLIQILSWWMFGLETTKQLYPFITHLPLIVVLSLYFKRPWTFSISSVLTAYLCCQIPSWMASFMGAVVRSHLADHISYFIAICVVYFFLKRYVADSIKSIMEQSTLSCLLFGAVPLLYYLFDYATTVYTDLLYSGARVAVQFTPYVICTFYLLFVLQYYKESQKQEVAKRERDIFAVQLTQAQIELDTMRQIQKGTSIYRHDMRHHLSLIGLMAADGDLKKIKEYLAITANDMDALTPLRFCENETVNLILSSFEARAKKDRIALHIDVKLPAELYINDTELCSLLSNALENAIVAAAKIEEENLRKVYIHAIINGGKLVISTENAYVGKLEMEGELPKSKSKEAGHGFGIKSIVGIVERHNGLYSIETEGGVFILRVMIPLNNVMDSRV
jgi:hypothetical protein